MVVQVFLEHLAPTLSVSQGKKALLQATLAIIAVDLPQACPAPFNHSDP